MAARWREKITGSYKRGALLGLDVCAGVAAIPFVVEMHVTLILIFTTLREENDFSGFYEMALLILNRQN